jgi:hypothetical protein
MRDLCFRSAVVAILAFAMLSCGEVPLRDTEKALREELAPQLELAVSAIQPGYSDRQSVRAALGEPWITSDLFRFDAFRIEASVLDPRLLFVIVPVPVPLGASGAGYVVVTYQADGTVESVEQSIDPPHGESYEAFERVPVLAGSAGVSIVNMPFFTARAVEVDAGRRGQLAETAAGGDCPILIGCFDCRPMLLYIPTGLLLDGRPPMTGRQQSSPVRVSPGRHVLSLPAARDEIARAEFDCDAGQPLYATLYPKAVQGSWHRDETHWEISIRPTLEAAYDSERLLIDDGKRWLELSLRMTDQGSRGFGP